MTTMHRWTRAVDFIVLSLGAVLAFEAFEMPGSREKRSGNATDTAGQSVTVCFAAGSHNHWCYVIWGAVGFIVTSQFVVICCLCVKNKGLRKGTGVIRQGVKTTEQVELVNVETDPTASNKNKPPDSNDVYSTVVKSKNARKVSSSSESSQEQVRIKTKEPEQQGSEEDAAAASSDAGEPIPSQLATDGEKQSDGQQKVTLVMSQDAGEYCEISDTPNVLPMAERRSSDQSDEVAYDTLYKTSAQETNELDSMYESLMKIATEEEPDDDLPLPPPPLESL